MEDEDVSPPSFEEIVNAHECIRPYVQRTPVFHASSIDRMVCDAVRTTCPSLDEGCCIEVYFKAEHLQRTGSFKVRGAFHALSKLSEEEAQRGVVTHSSGNHAQALACAAVTLNVKADIIIPVSAPASKRQSCDRFSSEHPDLIRVHSCGPTQKEREAAAADVLEKTGGVFIPPYDHPLVMAGQGTLALEILDSIPEVDVLVIPVGGGGMLSGCSIAARGWNDIHHRGERPLLIFGAEPQGADDAFRSFSSGEWVPQLSPKTIADGLKTSLGKRTWPVIRDRCDGIATCSEEGIRDSMRIVYTRLKQVIEPSAAVGLGSLLEDKQLHESISSLLSQREDSALHERARDSDDRPSTSLNSIRRKTCRIVVVLCGGNVDLDQPLPWQQE